MYGECIQIQLKNWLKCKGVKQNYIAEKTKLSTCSISLFIHGRRILASDKLSIIMGIIEG